MFMPGRMQGKNMNLDMKVMNTSIDNVGNSEYFGTTVIN
jgi:hypothetical protein